MENKFDRLKQLLESEKKWPLKYCFKFIIDNNDEKIQRIKNALPNPHRVKFKTSKNIKYVAISSIEYMKSPQDIINIYEEVSKIEGLMII